jgi:hypothetical protein
VAKYVVIMDAIKSAKLLFPVPPIILNNAPKSFHQGHHQPNPHKKPLLVLETSAPTLPLNSGLVSSTLTSTVWVTSPALMVKYAVMMDATKSVCHQDKKLQNHSSSALHKVGIMSESVSSILTLTAWITLYARMERFVVHLDVIVFVLTLHLSVSILLANLEDLLNKSHKFSDYSKIIIFWNKLKIFPEL